MCLIFCITVSTANTAWTGRPGLRLWKHSRPGLQKLFQLSSPAPLSVFSLLLWEGTQKKCFTPAIFLSEALTVYSMLQESFFFQSLTFRAKATYYRLLLNLTPGSYLQWFLGVLAPQEEVGSITASKQSKWTEFSFLKLAGVGGKFILMTTCVTWVERFWMDDNILDENLCYLLSDLLTCCTGDVI